MGKVNLIPIMKSNTQDGFQLYSSWMPPTLYRGFDEDNSTYVSERHTSYNISVHFPSVKTIDSYTISAGYSNNTDGNVLSWKLLGLVGSDWIVLHSGSKSQAAKTLDFSFKEVDVSAVRIINNAPPSSSYWGFNFIKVYEVPPLNKSFILSSDGYKRYEEESPEIKGARATINMTTNVSPYGTASASSVALVPNYDAWKAFDGIKTEGSHGWVTPSNITSGWLRYDFIEAKIIDSYKIYPQFSAIGSTLGLPRAPMNWVLEGSNDSSQWVVLDKRDNIVAWIPDKPISFNVSNKGSYKFYRLNVTAVNGGNQLGIGELEMFEVSIPASPPSWETVSPTLPTLSQFQEEGMEDLSSLDRKVQPVLESPQQMTSSVLGEGKVFKGAVNLQKYFDLRKVEVK